MSLRAMMNWITRSRMTQASESDKVRAQHDISSELDRIAIP